MYAVLADHRRALLPPELFADVARQGGGHPSVPAEVIATVMVLQAWKAGRTARPSTRCVATQNTVTQLVAAIRRVRRLVGQAREVELTAHDYDRPGRPVCLG